MEIISFLSSTGIVRTFALAYIVSINVLTFVLYGLDKRKAQKAKWRVPESTLLWLAAWGGSIGALLGMILWRHKTQHKKFTLGLPAILLLQVALILTWILR